VLGVLLVLALPGYAVAAALFPVAALAMLDRVLVSLGLSMAMTILTGVVLGLTNVPLSPASWAAGLLLVTVVASVISWRSVPVVGHVRRAASSLGTRGLATSRPRIPRRDVALFGLAVVCVAVALAIARIGALNAPSQGFTQLWMVQGEGNVVQVGVSNHEGAPTKYRLVLRTPSGQVAEWPSIELNVGEQWTSDAQVPNTAPNLELDLYLAERPDSIYRQVVWGSGASPAISPPP
jgi:uncharacterized membrane protein